MSLDQDISLLSRVGLFQGFSPDQLRLIAFGADREQLREGAVLFQEGEMAEGGYVVASGQVDLIVHRGRRQIVIDKAEEGGLVGEVALIAANRRSTDAVARADSELLYISRSLFHRMLREYPETAAFLHGRIAQSVRRLMSQMSEVHDRLADLSSLSDLTALRDSDPIEPEENGEAPSGQGQPADDTAN
ncbi:MAG: cyclic nucleotide-binding domain-containing protein [Pseudomonadota bacterium]|nr:cyclic nucleotide-binding domain-containing protein [Pseudomonadota bacterium]